MKNIPYGHQWVNKSDIDGVVRVLRSDFITQGPKINEFEDFLCRYTGAKYAVAVSSGTAGLHIAALAAGIKPGDEVVTSPLTFAASANCVLYSGGKPVFSDVERDTANMDIREMIKNTTGKTKVIIPVHFSGHPCDLKKIKDFADKRKLTVIEDAAHALGARYAGSKVGSCGYSDMTVFSFHPVKSITTGEGGAVMTNRRDLYEKLLVLRNHGITKDERKMGKTDGPWYYEMQELGFNYRITDFQCALGISQLKRLDKMIETRRRIAAMYDSAFRDNGIFDTPPEKDYAYSAYHLYPIRLKDKFKKQRKTVFMKLRGSGIGVQVHYIPVYRHPYYRKNGFKSTSCPNAEDYYKREISIPLYSTLKDEQVKKVVDSVLSAFKTQG